MGLIFIIGPSKMGTFFFRRTKWRGSLAFSVGLFLILYKHTIVGMAMELFGLLNLFGYDRSYDARSLLFPLIGYRDFFPYLLTFARKMPVVGKVLSLPYISGACDHLYGTRLPV